MEGEKEEEVEDLPTPDGLSPTEASLLRWVRAVVELFDARAQVEPSPYRLPLYPCYTPSHRLITPPHLPFAGGALQAAAAREGASAGEDAPRAGAHR